MMRQASWTDEAKCSLSLPPDFWHEYGPSVPIRLTYESRKGGELGAGRPDLGERKPREDGFKLAKKKKGVGRPTRRCAGRYLHHDHVAELRLGATWQ